MKMKISLLTFFACCGAGLFAQAPRLVVPIGHTGGITSVAVSHADSAIYFLTGSGDNSAKLWDSSGHELLTFLGHEYGVEAVAFSPDGKSVLTGSSDGTARLWDLSGKTTRTFKHSAKVTSVAFSPADGGKAVLTGCEDNSARLWKLFGAAPLTLKHNGKVNAVAFSPDGKSILTGSDDKTAALWDLSGTKLRTFSGHAAAVWCVTFSSDGKSVLTGSFDGTARHWSLSGSALRTFNHTGEVRTAVFSPDGQTVVTGSIDGIIKLWDLSGKETLSYRGYDWGLSSACFSPDGKLILTGSEDYSAARLRDPSGRVVQSLSGHTNAITALALSPAGKSMLTASVDSTVKLWDVLSQEVRTFKHPDRVSSVAFSPPATGDSAGGKFILSGCEDKTVRLRDLSGKEVQSFKHADKVSAVAFSPADGGKTVLAAGFNGAIKLWDTSGNEIRTFKDNGKINSVAFSPDGQSVLTGGYEGDAKLWYLSGQAPQTIAASSQVNAVAFSPDGQSVLTGSYNGTTQLWNLSGQEIQTLRQPESEVLSAGFSPDGKYVVTGNQNALVRVWDLSANTSKTFAGHTTEISAVVFSPNGRSVVSGSRDGTVKIWDWTTENVRATLIALDSSDWVVTTPDGLFDASPGAMKLMYYMVGLEVVELAQLKERYYEPGLLARVIGLDRTALRKVEDIEDKALALYPQLMEATITGDIIQVRLEKRGGGIGNAVVLLDGKMEIIPDANPERRESFRIDLSKYAEYFYPDSSNHLSLIFYNADGWLQSPPYVLDYRPGGAKEKGDPASPQPTVSLNDKSDQKLINTLYALIVGTSDYDGGGIDLLFPDKDALAFREMLSLAGAALFGSRMEIKLLTTSAVADASKSSKNEIRAALKDFAAKAEPKDIVLVFLSGHGTTWPENSEKGQFHYLTAENSSFDFSDAQNRGKAIPQDSLQAWIREVKARKRILILDACNSGQVVKQLDLGAKGGGLNADQRRALESMKDRSGFFVLAGSAADKSSFEDPRFSHGLLTYSLLRNIPKVAAGDKNRAVNVGKLFQEVREDVPKLAQEINKVQEPKLIGMEDFSIGIINDSAQASKLLATRKIITRSSFSNNKNRLDHLGFTDEINAQLEQLLSSPTLPFTFWPEMDKATGTYYTLNGGYDVSGKDLKVTAFFSKNGQEVLKEFKASGSTDKVKVLVEKLVDDFADYLDTWQ